MPADQKSYFQWPLLLYQKSQSLTFYKILLFRGRNMLRFASDEASAYPSSDLPVLRSNLIWGPQPRSFIPAIKIESFSTAADIYDSFLVPAGIRPIALACPDARHRKDSLLQIWYIP